MKSLAWYHSSWGQSSSLSRGLEFQSYNIHLFKKTFVEYLLHARYCSRHWGCAQKQIYWQISLPHWFHRHSQNHSCNGRPAVMYRWVNEAQRHWMACYWSFGKSKGRAKCPDSWLLLAIPANFGIEHLLYILDSPARTFSSLLCRGYLSQRPLDSSSEDAGTSAPGAQSCLGVCHWQRTMFLVLWKYMDAEHCFSFFFFKCMIFMSFPPWGLPCSHMWTWQEG